jgi:hypothetical protein
MTGDLNTGFCRQLKNGEQICKKADRSFTAVSFAGKPEKFLILCRMNPIALPALFLFMEIKGMLK